ncbi:MAG: cobalamin-binding protein [Burkholderiales bacterium]
MQSLLCGLLYLSGLSHAAIELRDDRGKRVVLGAPAARIITLAPHLTELVFAVGAGDRLVGVARYSDYPSAATALPVIGDSAKLDFERILELKPDLVLAWRSGNHPAEITRLEELGIPVYVTEPARLTDIARVIRALGSVSGNSARAAQVAADFENRISELRGAYTAGQPVRVFYEVWNTPLLTVNGKHLISEVISLCGGVNIFESEHALVPTISMENVLAADPQIILTGASTRAEAIQRWLPYARISAVRRERIFAIDPELLQRATPRVLEGARLACGYLKALPNTGHD